MSGSESSMAGTDTAGLIISGGNRPAIEGRGGAGDDTMRGGSGDDQIRSLGGGSTTYDDAGDDAPYAVSRTDTIESGDSNTVHDDDDDSDGDGQ